MQTSFTDKQLQDKDNKISETIIRKCVHCGMCNATCPTFGVNGEELEGWEFTIDGERSPLGISASGVSEASVVRWSPA